MQQSTKHFVRPWVALNRARHVQPSAWIGGGSTAFFFPMNHVQQTRTHGIFLSPFFSLQLSPRWFAFLSLLSTRATNLVQHTCCRWSLLHHATVSGHQPRELETGGVQCCRRSCPRSRSRIYGEFGNRRGSDPQSRLDGDLSSRGAVGAPYLPPSRGVPGIDARRDQARFVQGSVADVPGQARGQARPGPVQR